MGHVQNVLSLFFVAFAVFLSYHSLLGSTKDLDRVFSNNAWAGVPHQWRVTSLFFCVLAYLNIHRLRTLEATTVRVIAHINMATLVFYLAGTARPPSCSVCFPS